MTVYACFSSILVLAILENAFNAHAEEKNDFFVFNGWCCWVVLLFVSKKSAFTFFSLKFSAKLTIHLLGSHGASRYIMVTSADVDDDQCIHKIYVFCWTQFPFLILNVLSHYSAFKQLFWVFFCSFPFFMWILSRQEQMWEYFKSDD